MNLQPIRLVFLVLLALAIAAMFFGYSRMPFDIVVALTLALYLLGVL